MSIKLISNTNIKDMLILLSKTAPKHKESYSFWLYPNKLGYFDLAIVSSSNNTLVVINDVFFCDKTSGQIDSESVIQLSLLGFLESTKNIDGKCVITLNEKGDLNSDNRMLSYKSPDECVFKVVVSDELGNNKTTINGAITKINVCAVMDMIESSKKENNIKFKLRVETLKTLFNNARQKSCELISENPFTKIKPSFAVVETEKFYLLMKTNENAVELNVTAFHAGLGNIFGRHIDTVLLTDTISIASTGEGEVLLGVSLKNMIDIFRPIFGKNEFEITVVNNQDKQMIVAKKGNIFMSFTLLTKPPKF